MRILVLLVLAVALAGCLAEPAAPAEDDPVPEVETTDPEPVTDDGPSASSTLAEPPTWQAGRWWRVRVTERFTPNASHYVTTRVVAGVEPSSDSYLVGMPASAWSDPNLLLHVPGFGRVARDDLGYEIHDCPFRPLDFPLTDGKTWKTEFECRPVDATVTVESPTRASIEMIGPNDHLTLTYDATAGTIVEMDIDGYGLVEVVDRGRGFQGNVTVPHGHDLVFQHGRVAGAVDLGLAPAPPVESVTVDESYDQVSFLFILGTILPSTDGPQGVYREEAVAPDGTTYTATVTPLDGTGLRFFFHRQADPGGAWQLRHVAGGPGLAMIEGIGYEVLHRTL